MFLSETGTTEFKREYTTDINKAVIAFANTNGGTLYIGIDNNGSVIGVTNVDTEMLKVSNSIRSATVHLSVSSMIVLSLLPSVGLSEVLPMMI